MAPETREFLKACRGDADEAGKLQRLGFARAALQMLRFVVESVQV